MEREKERITNPAFGVITVGKGHCGGRIGFFGSELPQNSYVYLEIHTAELERELTKDWIFPRDAIIKVRMSSLQFAELITSMNQGGGIPCTIEYVKNENIPAYENIESRKEFINRKFKDRMNAFSKTIKEQQESAIQLVKKKTLSKQDIQDLTHHLSFLTQEVSSNIPYFAECFQETIDESVLEAKLEIEAAIEHKIKQSGLEFIKNANEILDLRTKSDALSPKRRRKK